MRCRNPQMRKRSGELASHRGLGKWIRANLSTVNPAARRPGRQERQRVVLSGPRRDPGRLIRCLPDHLEQFLYKRRFHFYMRWRRSQSAATGLGTRWRRSQTAATGLGTRWRWSQSTFPKGQWTARRLVWDPVRLPRSAMGDNSVAATRFACRNSLPSN